MKILVVRLGALGDILHAVPAQQQLHQSLADSEIHWLAESKYQSLLGSVSGISRVWTLSMRKWLENPLQSREILRLAAHLRRQNFDLSFDFQGLFKSAALARLSGARRILGFAPERFKESASRWFYTETIAGEANLNRHVIDVNLDLVSQVIPVQGATAEVPLSIPREDDQYIRNQLTAHQIDRPVLINPGAGWVTKLWPADRFARLGALIERHLQLPVIYTYGPGEEHLIEEIRRTNSPGAVVSFPTTILQLARLCQTSRLLIGGDSGPLHLAVSQGTPTVAILGPTSPKRNGPYTSADEVVKRFLPCSDSYKRRCNHFICMDIAVETVFEAVLRRLNRDVGRAGKKEGRPSLRREKALDLAPSQETSPGLA